MKNTLKILAIILFIGLSGCDKKFDFITSYPFEIKENHRELSTINIAESTLFEINPEQFVTINVYEFKYTVNSGSGYYLDESKEIIEADTWFTLDKLLFDFDFIGTTVGEVKVSVEIRDSQRLVPIDLLYNIEQNPFSVDLNTISTTATVDERKNFTLILANTGDDPNVTYEAALFLSQGVGTIELFNDQGEVVHEINQNQKFPIKPGTYNYAVTLNNDGVNILKVDIVDSNGQKGAAQIEFAVNVINFNFTGEPERNTTALGNDIKINFNTLEIDGGNDTYEMRYVLTQGNAELYAGPTQVFAGVNTPVNLGAYSWIFRPIEIGMVDLTFIARNTTGVEKEVNISIEVIDRDFEFTATPTLTSLELGETVGINYVITEEGGNQTDDYTMTYSSSKNGTLTINGITYMPGQVITLPSLTFFAEYEGTAAGDHEISSTITAVSNNNPKTKEVTFEYLPSQFTFDVTTATELTVGDTIPIDFNINEVSGKSTFDINYAITGVNQEFKNDNGILLQPNTNYDVDDNTFSWDLKALEQGTMEVTWTVTNQYGVEEPKKITYTIKPIDFDFSVSPVGSNFKTGDQIQFNFNMDAPASLSYSLSFDTNGEGFVKYNGIAYQKDESFTVTNTNVEVLGLFETSGQNFIKWTITASNGVVKEYDNTILITKKPLITSIDTDFLSCTGRNCDCSNQTIIEVTFEKDPNAIIQSVRVTNFQADGSIEYERTEQLSLQGSDTFFVFDQCVRTTRRGGESLKITITDSLGQTSEAFSETF